MRSFSNAKHRLTAASILTALATFGCGHDAPTVSTELRVEPAKLGERGPGTVGFGSFSVQADTELVVKVWYPAQSDAGGQEDIEYDVELKVPEWQEFNSKVIHGRAIRDAPVDKTHGPYPVVLFSHGYAMSPEVYSHLLEHWASHGFIVIAPEHRESDWFQAATTLQDRPADLTATLDFTGSEQFELRAVVDLSRIAAIGHSFGGYSTLALAGARLDLGQFQAFCEDVEQRDPRAFVCAPFLASLEDVAMAAGMDEDLSRLGPSMRDERIDAAVVMAGDAYMFSPDGLEYVTIPILAMGGTEDFSTPWELGAERTFDGVASETRYLIGFEGGGHMIPLNSCDDMPWTGQLPAEYSEIFCQDAVWDKAEGLELTARYSTAFLRAELQGDNDARSHMAAHARSEDGINFDSP